RNTSLDMNQRKSAAPWRRAARRGSRPLGCRGMFAGRSLDHLIRPLQERRRDRQAEHPGGLEVDHQTPVVDLLDREVSWLCPLEDPVDIARRAAKHVEEVWHIGEEATR